MDNELPKLRRTDSSTIDPRWPWSQDNFINVLVQRKLIENKNVARCKKRGRPLGEDGSRVDGPTRNTKETLQEPNEPLEKKEKTQC